MINRPIYCLTSDLDWASDACIEDLLSLTEEFRITPTVFATHDSPVVERFTASHPTAVGIHPNFLPASTHGKDPQSVIDHMFSLFPNAEAFRSHSFFDGSHILDAMAKRGVRYDSNLCLHLQPCIVPLRLGAADIIRFPVFWEDDYHWTRADGDWEFTHFIDAFTSPGLKILNVHPVILSINAPSREHYLEVRERVQTLSAEEIVATRYNGKGPRTFLHELLRYLVSQEACFYTLRELYDLLPVGAVHEESEGRQSPHTDAEFEAYWRMRDTEKQRFVRNSYSKRNAEDAYATSRDFNLRELEIQAIGSQLAKKGRIVDLGCGNGHTLLSLAKNLPGWDLTGVDFSENLIDGANHLLERERPHLKSIPTFVLADAVEYLKGLPDASVDYVLTERFILNLPTAEWQELVIREAFRVLQEDGLLLLCEGSEDGFQSLNDVREKLKLERIPGTSADNVTAIRMDEQWLENLAQSQVGFTPVGKYGFSTYFLISRVLHPLMVAPAEPRFASPFNKIAREIQENTEFNAGYGSNVLWVWKK